MTTAASNVERAANAGMNNMHLHAVSLAGFSAGAAKPQEHSD